MAAAIPRSFRKLICEKLTANFREATKIVSVDCSPLKPTEVLVKTRYVGINATDINVTAGRYARDTPQLPFDIGFEAVGEVVEVGSAAANVKVGQAVGLMSNGAFAEYSTVDSSAIIPLPSLKPDYLAFFVSGLTASIALDKVGELKSTDSVLITAAAGGTGQFAVQWAKLKGCKKILGTASTPEKLEFLKSIGVTRAINYKTENLQEVIKQELPKGVDVVYESVGGSTFETALSNLAVRGRLITIGSITDYEAGSFGRHQTLGLQSKVLTKSASVRGFLLFHFREEFKEYLKKLIVLFETKQLKVTLDLGQSTGKQFTGMEDIVRAVEYLYTGKSIGKIVVEISSASKL